MTRWAGTDDAYGQEIQAIRAGRASHEIIERDDGYIDAYTGDYLFAPFGKWQPADRKAMRFVRGRVLDVGAGAGRVALYLQEKGHDVVAIDISEEAVAVCRARGVKDVRHMAFGEVDASLGMFDTVVMFGNNFGLFGTRARARKLLRLLHGVTSDRGRIVAQTLDPYVTRVPEHIAYHERNRKRGRMGGQVRIRARFGGQKTPWFDYLFVSRDEMRGILDGTGWHLERSIDTDGPQYNAVIEKD